MKSYLAFKIPGLRVVNPGRCSLAGSVSRAPAAARNGPLSPRNNAMRPDILFLNPLRPE